MLVTNVHGTVATCIKDKRANHVAGCKMQNRRTLLSVAGTGALVTAIALMPKAVRAENQVPFQATLTVQFMVAFTPEQCAVGDTTCSTCTQAGGGFVDAQGLAETTMGPLFAKVLKCSSGSPAPYGGYVGTLTLSTTPPVTSTSSFPSILPAPKDVLTFTYVGKNTDNGDTYGFEPFIGTLTVDSGTGTFQGTQGKLTFIAQGGPPLVAAEAGVTPSPFSASGMAFYHIEGTLNTNQ